jgi:hypothetical protein
LAAQGPKERFGMMGMDICLCTDPRCLRMFPPGTLIFGALATFLLCWCTVILPPDVHTSFESLLGSPWLAIFPQRLTSLKAQRALTALPIRKATQIMGMSRNTGS